jgi:phosphate transport system ATP-binding protein
MVKRAKRKASSSESTSPDGRTARPADVLQKRAGARSVADLESCSPPSVVELSRPLERMAIHRLGLSFGKRRVLDDVSLSIPANQVTSVIGPTGSGKSSLLRCLNRMNDQVEGARLEGEVLLDGVNIYKAPVEVAQLRKRVGMVFHESKPFPTSVFENIAYAPRVTGMRDGRDLRDCVRRTLLRMAMWDEMRDLLDEQALRLPHGQQYRLCIARSLATDPDVLLMDEPTAILDPAATVRVEDLIFELRDTLTIVLATNNIQQAARISDRTAFLLQGRLVEAGATTDVFTCPDDPQTEDYVCGRFS